MAKTSIIILHYKNETDTIDCLNSIIQNIHNQTDFDFIVVLNSSSSRFLHILKTKYPCVHIVENAQNTGFAQGANIGIKKSLSLEHENVILMNNDTVVYNGLMEGLVEYAQSHKKAGLISPKIYFEKGYEYHRNRYKDNDKGKVVWYAGGNIDWENVYASHRGVDEVDSGQYDDEMETDFATGCCMLIKREVIETIGFFDKNYFLYYEDVDYSVRAKRKKFQIHYNPKVSIWHKNAASSEKPGSSIHVYYQTRNRLYFGFKYAPLKTRKSLVFDSLKLLFRGQACFQGVRDYYFGRMGGQNV